MSLFNEFTTPNCPADCDSEFLLPALPEDPDCELTERFSEISDLFITPCGVDNPFDWTQSPVALVADAIDNTDTANLKTKQLVGIGTIGDHEATTRVTARFRRNIIKRRYTLEFTASVADDLQYEFARYLQCNWREFVFQYATVGGDLFGDVNGIIPSFVDVFLPKASGEEAAQEARYVIEFDTTNGDPRRGVNPLFTANNCIGASSEVITGV